MLRLYPNLAQPAFVPAKGTQHIMPCKLAVDRQFARGFRLTASYTWSKYLDSTSEGVGNQGGNSPTGRTGLPCRYPREAWRSIVDRATSIAHIG